MTHRLWKELWAAGSRLPPADRQRPQVPKGLSVLQPAWTVYPEQDLSVVALVELLVLLVQVAVGAMRPAGRVEC